MNRVLFAIVLFATLSGSPGCGSQPRGYDHVVPPSSLAQRALAAALEDWQHGKPPGRIDRITPPVLVVDSQRNPGQSLERFEILGEVPVENARCFSVRLLLAQPAEQVLARYNIFGREPVWVFRLEDYEMISHWEHATGETTENPSTTPPKSK